MGLFEDEFKNTPDKDVPVKESLDESSAYLLPKVEISEFQERDLDTFSDQAKEVALNRRELLLWVDKELLDGGWTEKNLTPLLNEAKILFDFPIPSWRTVCRWWSSYKKSGYKVIALAPKTEKKGNRSNRIQEEEELFISEAIERWLTPQRPSISSAYQFYCDRVRVHNQNSENELPLRTYKSFKVRVDALPDYDVLLHRHGKYKADKEFRRRGKSIPQERILQRVEIDHTPLDIILLDDEDLVPLGRPTLTVLVDCYSKCVIGFYLGYNDASYYSARKAIINAVSPKTYLGALYTDIEHDWSCQGKIENLVVDNGKEFWSNSLDNACREIGMNVQINPKGSPWLKPLVERFFGTLKDQLIQNIPGHTFPLLKDLENYDPNKHAVMRMGKFVALFHLWIVDIYNRSTDSRGIKIPPNTLWDASFNKLPPVLYQDQELQEFKLKTALVDERTLSKDGIQYEHLVYQNNELNEYRKYHYKNLLDDASGGKRTSRKKEKLIIKIDPDDLSFIHVYLPDWEKYLKVACVDPEGYTQGLSLHQHKVNLKLHRNLVSSKVDLDSLARVRMAIHERIQEEAEFIRNSDKRRTKTNKALAKHSNIGSDNNNTLATSAHNPLPVEDQPSITEQKAVLNNTDWDSAIDDIEAY